MTRLLARRPAQRPARHWGRHTAAPNALKTGHCKQTFTHFNVVPTQYDREKRFGASANARRHAFRRIARPSVQQGIGGGTLLPPMHQKLGIASKHSQILTLCQHNTTEKKRIGASAKARRRAFQRIARPNVWRQGKTFHFSSFLTDCLSPFTVEGPGAPPPSSAPRALTGARCSCSHWGALLLSITLQNTNNGGGTAPRTFVGTPRRCGFHPSDVDG